MSAPYIGEIRMAGFGFAPTGWALCQGQTLSISQYSALFAVLGTTYGGNGVTTFLLPDLRGRMPVHQGQGITIGQTGGEATHVLLATELPLHTHQLEAAATATVASPAGAVFAPGPAPIYSTTPETTLALTSIGMTGSGQAHPNMNPYQALNFIIALTGIFPSQD